MIGAVTPVIGVVTPVMHAVTPVIPAVLVAIPAVMFVNHAVTPLIHVVTPVSPAVTPSIYAVIPIPAVIPAIFAVTTTIPAVTRVTHAVIPVIRGVNPMIPAVTSDFCSKPANSCSNHGDAYSNACALCVRVSWLECRPKKQPNCWFLVIFLSISEQAPYKILQTVEQTLSIIPVQYSPPIPPVVAIPTFPAIRNFFVIHKRTKVLWL